jgi:AcrR family transcriptional regulator
MPRRTKDEAEQTRNTILDAAEHVFYKNGVARTTLEQIAQAAKVTRGAVYWHFNDKIEVLDAMMSRVFLPQEDILERLAASGSDHPLDDLQQACAEALRNMGRDKRRNRVVSIMMHRCEYTEEMAPIMKRRRDCKDRMLERSLKLMEQAQKLEQLSKRWTPRLAALSLQAMMTGLITGALEGRKAFDFNKSAPACLEAFFKSLKRCHPHAR